MSQKLLEARHICKKEESREERQRVRIQKQNEEKDVGNH